jgi:hypothetical protein
MMKRLFIVLVLSSLSAQAQTITETFGSGTNSTSLFLNFPSGEVIILNHRWNGNSINGKTLVETCVQATGGELIVTDGYLTPFSGAILLLSNPEASGLVVHYQGSYAAPYINGIRWGGPNGAVGAGYQYPDSWWHLWVRGPALVDQSYAWPDPLPPINLTENSDWDFAEFSNVEDIQLDHGSAMGLVYGSSSAPTPEPSSLSLLLAGGAVLIAGRRRKWD